MFSGGIERDQLHEMGKLVVETRNLSEAGKKIQHLILTPGVH